MRSAILLPLLICLASNAGASGVFNSSPDWSCNLPGNQSNLRLASVLLDQDDYPDLVIGNTASDHLLVYLGNGDGSFSVNQEYSLPNPIWIETADIDGDLDEDVIVRFSVSSGDSIAVFFNHRDGIISDPVTSAESLGASSIETASFDVFDFTGDGVLDILIPHVTGYIELLVGMGSGYFQSEYLFSGLSTAKALDAGDVDSDGDPDLVVVDAGHISVLLNDGTGGVTLAGVYGDLPNDCSLGSIALEDLNSDGYQDIATCPGTAMCSYTSVCFLLGDGNGAFTQQEGQYFCGDPFNHIVVTDVDKDGHADAFFNGCSGNYLLLGDGQGGFSEDYYYSGTQGYCWKASVADFDIDGDLDYATVTEPGIHLTLEVFLNQTIMNDIEEDTENSLTQTLLLNESPVSGFSSVAIVLPEGCFCTLATYDINGRKLQEVYSGNLPSGSSEVIWDTTQLIPGCYFLRLDSGEGESTIVRCMVVD